MKSHTQQIQWDVGFFGICGDPIHVGHLSIIYEAAFKVGELYVGMSYSRKRDRIDVRERFRWLVAATSHLQNVKVFAFSDDCSSKAEYGDDEWKLGYEQVCAEVGKPIDVVFVGGKENRHHYERLYGASGSEIVELDRFGTLSSSAVIADPFGYWESMPRDVQTHFVKKVLILGGESTGKSTLVRCLANLWGTTYVEEYGKEVVVSVGGVENITDVDVLHIASEHQHRVAAATTKANKFVFVDTDVFTTMHYCPSLQEGVAETFESLLKPYDLVFWVEGERFVQDGTRDDNPAARAAFADGMKNFYRKRYPDMIVLATDTFSRIDAIGKEIERRYHVTPPYRR